MGADGKITVQVTLDETEYNRMMGKLPNTTQQGLHKTLGIYDMFKAGVSKIFSMIKSSISSAMSRFDTMDQFSRVMTTMLGSTPSQADRMTRMEGRRLLRDLR